MGTKAGFHARGLRDSLPRVCRHGTSNGRYVRLVRQNRVGSFAEKAGCFGASEGSCVCSSEPQCTSFVDLEGGVRDPAFHAAS